MDKNIALNSHALSESTACGDHSDKCSNNLCETCKDAKLFSERYHLDDANLDKEMKCYQWKMLSRKNRKEHHEKAMKTGQAINAFNYACDCSYACDSFIAAAIPCLAGKYSIKLC